MDKLSKKRNSKSSKRIKQITIDKDGNLVVAIVKYNAIKCLFHSFYGLMVIIFVAGSIVAFAKDWIVMAIASLLVGLLLWALSWLNANDALKKNLFPSLLLDFLESQTDSRKGEPTLAVFYPSMDYIKCVEADGSITRYAVEFIMEKLLLYVVKIHTSPSVWEGH